MVDIAYATLPDADFNQDIGGGFWPRLPFGDLRVDDRFAPPSPSFRLNPEVPKSGRVSCHMDKHLGPLGLKRGGLE